MSAEFLAWAGLILGWLSTAFTVAYNRWNALFLFVNRIRFWVTNPTALWTVRVSFSGEFADKHVDAVVARLRQQWPDARKQGQTGTSLTLRASGLLIDVQRDDAAGLQPWAGGSEGVVSVATRTERLTMRIADVRTTFRESAQLVDALTAVVEDAARSVGARGVEFGGTIRFSGTNPYFGLYVRRLRPDDVRAFQCTFDVSVSGSGSEPAGTVTVGQHTVDVYAKNAVNWAKLSKQYLAVR